MIYRNTKTGAIIDSSCAISGGDWVPEDGWAVTQEDDGKVHVRPVQNGEIMDTPVVRVEKPKPRTRKR